MDNSTPLEPMPTCTVRLHRLDPTLAEVHIDFADLPPDVELRGRVMGPRCPGVGTVEVAYALRLLAHPRYQVLIPEPLCWSPEQPYVYEGPIEFFRDGKTMGKIAVSFGVRTP